MDRLLGLLSIHVRKGVNLAVMDMRGSDPYVIFGLGQQILKTRVVKNTTNPVWDEVLTFSISGPLPIKLEVYDKDTFTHDDKMGDAEIDINPFLKALKMNLCDLPNETIISTVKPTRTNYVAEESYITWTNGKVIQKMVLRLQNVASGEIEIQLGWTEVPGSKGLR